MADTGTKRVPPKSQCRLNSNLTELAPFKDRLMIQKLLSQNASGSSKGQFWPILVPQELLCADLQSVAAMRDGKA